MDNFRPLKNCLENKTILLTGSGSGIGRTAAVTLAKYGAQLVLISKDLHKLESLHEEIVSQGLKEPLIHSMDFENAEEEEYQQIKEALKIGSKD